MAQFNPDIDSGIIRISQFILRFCHNVPVIEYIQASYMCDNIPCDGESLLTLRKPVGVKLHPGPSLPKLMAQFNPEQTGWRKTTPRPFFTQTDGIV